MNPQEIVAEVLDHLRGMWRFRWLAAGISWLIFTVGALYVYSLPPVYQASAQVFIDTNTMIEPLMRGLTAQHNPQDRVSIAGRALLARPNLVEVARRSGLVTEDMNAVELDKAVSRLQRNIRIDGARRENVISIRYEHVSRGTATAVVRALVDTFVEGTEGARDDDAEVSERALLEELRVHEERLNEAEAALAAFRRDNVGYMPDEYGDYAGRLQAALTALEGTRQRIRLAMERRDALLRQLSGEQVVAVDVNVGCSYREELGRTATELAALQVQYTERHPRVVQLASRIETLERLCAAELDALKGRPAATASTASEINPIYQDLRIQLNNAEVEIAELNAQLATQEDTVERLRADVDKIAEVEKELKRLNRDYSVVQGRHQELLARWEALKAKQRLSEVTDSVRFQEIEPPYALPDPVGPQRAFLLAGVVLVSFGAGGGAAFGLNQLKPVFFTRRKLRRIVGRPVLGAVNLIRSPRAKLLNRLDASAWIGSYALLLVVSAGAVLFATQGSELLRSLLPGSIG